MPSEKSPYKMMGLNPRAFPKFKKKQPSRWNFAGTSLKQRASTATFHRWGQPKLEDINTFQVWVANRNIKRYGANLGRTQICDYCKQPKFVVGDLPCRVKR